MLDELKTKKLPSKLTSANISRRCYGDRPSDAALLEEVKQSCDDTCRLLVQSVLQSYENRLHLERDALFQEVCQHRLAVINKCELFLGREKYIQRIVDYMKSGQKHKVSVGDYNNLGDKYHRFSINDVRRIALLFIVWYTRKNV